MPTETIERSIYFFRVDSDPVSDGTSAPFDAKAVFGALKKMAFDDDGLYLDAGNGHVNLVFVDKLSPNPRIRYATVRHHDLPTIESGGTLKPLGLGDDEGICEPIHAVFFDNNIVGAEFNFYGPRLTGLASYLKTKVPVNLMPKHLRFGMLLKDDPIESLNQLSSLKLMELKIRAANLDEASKLDVGANPFAILEGAAQFGKADMVDIVLQAGRKKDSFLSGTVRKFVSKLIGVGKLGLAEKFLIRGIDKDTGRTRTFDLLAQHLISTKQMVVLDAGYRAVNSASAYLQIVTAYNERKEELEQAPSA